MSMAEPPREGSPRRARRRHASRSRRRRLARIDVALGLLLAVVLLLASPGLAIAAIVALILLIACGISLLVQRRGSRRIARAGEEDRKPSLPPSPPPAGERERAAPR
jgi:Flp pilus assembly protein TadB